MGSTDSGWKDLSVHLKLEKQLNDSVVQVVVSSKVIKEGKITLIMMDEIKNQKVGNCRLMVGPDFALGALDRYLCYISVWSLQNEMLPLEEKGCRRNSQVTKNYHVIDKLIMNDWEKKII